MGQITPAGQGAADEKMLVELYCKHPGCDPVEELVGAVARSVRWKDRIDLRVSRFSDGPQATPYGLVADNAVVVCGVHVIHGVDYRALTRALEDCEELGADL
jgi:hypothetical protein